MNTLRIALCFLGFSLLTFSQTKAQDDEVSFTRFIEGGVHYFDSFSAQVSYGNIRKKRRHLWLSRVGPQLVITDDKTRILFPATALFGYDLFHSETIPFASAGLSFMLNDAQMTDLFSDSDKWFENENFILEFGIGLQRNQFNLGYRYSYQLSRSTSAQEVVPYPEHAITLHYRFVTWVPKPRKKD